MRHWLFLPALLSCFTTFSQTFTVGSTCCNYHLVNYSFPNVPYGPYSSYSNTYTIDIDGNLVSDIDINSKGYFSGSAGIGSYDQISVTSSTSCEFVYGTSTFTNCWYTTVIANVGLSTPLNSLLNWSLTPVSWGTPGQPCPFINSWQYVPSFQSSIYCGEAANPFYVGFRKILTSADTIYGWIRMDSHIRGKVYDYAYTCGTYTGTPPASTITTAPKLMCKGDSLLLGANPTGGVFFGAGVNGNYFKTKNLAAGVYTVNYLLPNPSGCSAVSSSVTFTVYAAAVTSTQTALCVGESLTLTAQPPGGVFSGTYISGNVFSPTNSGTYTATYSYTSIPGCSLSTSVTLTSNACVGIKEIDNLHSSITIYPNPANDKLSININDFNNIKLYRFKLISVEGKIVKSEILINSLTEIDVSGLGAGLYFVEFQLAGFSSRQKLLLTR